MLNKHDTITLAEAVARHEADVTYLCPTLDDWDLTILVTHYTDGVNDAYLGVDGETVFEVHGQSEPGLTADAAYWQMRSAMLAGKDDDATAP